MIWPNNLNEENRLMVDSTLDSFVKAIRERKIVIVRFFSKEDGMTTERKCVPLDYGPSRRARLKNDRFHFWDLESDKGSHVLSLNPEQVKMIIILDDRFQPEEIVVWNTKKSPWFVKRDWGDVS
jgi:hypothetical protein